MCADVDSFCIILQVHVFVGGVEEKLMANKAIKQAVEVMMNPGGKMSRVQEILRCRYQCAISWHPVCASTTQQTGTLDWYLNMITDLLVFCC